LPGSFTYRWPESLGEPVAGIRVRVPFGRGMRNGIVTAIAEAAPEVETRMVDDRLDTEPLLDSTRRRWLERLRRYYLAMPGEAWETALAWAANDELRRFRYVDKDYLEQFSPELAACFRTRAAISLKTMAARCSEPGIRYRTLLALQAGLLSEEIVQEEPGGSGSDAKPELTTAQQQAVDALLAARNTFASFLLFGRTGSGKTEVYLRAAEEMVAAGGQVLVLVPEIGLTPMWLARVAGRFARSSVWHSAMTDPERLQVQRRLAETDVLIGTRSALFLSLPRLAMIVVDEEHDASFKQQEGMAYSARDMAVLLAQELSIPVVLGSATPSQESWRLAKEGQYRRLDLPEAIAPQPPVQPHVIDMRGTEEPVSAPLKRALLEVKERGEQAILFLNRRGYSPALQCTACGDVPECPHCTLRLTLHRKARSLRCHACGYARHVPRVCSHCGEEALLPLGEGTEKLDEWLSSNLPELRVARFDRDVMTSHGRVVKTLEAFEKGDIDCLLGTQMLVKGHHFPQVTLVGVVNADLGVSLPDFRAGERWWQQMTQVMGRAGRGDRPGRMLIQTRMPEAPWLARMSENPAQVLDEELELRRQLHFPPFARWVRIVFSANDAGKALQAATQHADLLHRLPGIELSGPMPCSLERLAGRSRFELLLRDPERKTLPWKLEPLLAQLAVPSSVRRRVDVDPLDMM